MAIINFARDTNGVVTQTNDGIAIKYFFNTINSISPDSNGFFIVDSIGAIVDYTLPGNVFQVAGNPIMPSPQTSASITNALMAVFFKANTSSGGSGTTDLSNYYTKSQVDSLLSNLTQA